MRTPSPDDVEPFAFFPLLTVFLHCPAREVQAGEARMR